MLGAFAMSVCVFSCVVMVVAQAMCAYFGPSEVMVQLSYEWNTFETKWLVHAS